MDKEIQKYVSLHCVGSASREVTSGPTVSWRHLTTSTNWRLWHTLLLFLFYRASNAIALKISEQKLQPNSIAPLLAAGSCLHLQKWKLDSGAFMCDNETKRLLKNMASVCQYRFLLVVKALFHDSTLAGKYFADQIRVHFDVGSAVNIRAWESRFVLV